MVQNCVKCKSVLRGTDQLPEEKGALKGGAQVSLCSFSISSSSLDDGDQLAMSHMKNINLTLSCTAHAKKSLVLCCDSGAMGRMLPLLVGTAH